ncbi:unnamed protein product [Prorocentrum cordatum]|uniref:Uncharacterized protein n=1 Tax=Prorocentrum cordatum TaxID=2364126 RepID=A0ABN9VTU4_9DINO|nr:unnamed protein product [Polarella glacialis]
MAPQLEGGKRPRRTESGEGEGPRRLRPSLARREKGGGGRAEERWAGCVKRWRRSGGGKSGVTGGASPHVRLRAGAGSSCPSPLRGRGGERKEEEEEEEEEEVLLDLCLRHWGALRRAERQRGGLRRAGCAPHRAAPPGARLRGSAQGVGDCD